MRIKNVSIIINIIIIIIIITIILGSAVLPAGWATDLKRFLAIVIQMENNKFWQLKNDHGFSEECSPVCTPCRLLSEDHPQLLQRKTQNNKKDIKTVISDIRVHLTHDEHVFSISRRIS